MVSISQDLAGSAVGAPERPRYVFHITTLGDWAEQKRAGEYRLATLGRPLPEGGFIHAGTAGQVEGVANAMFRGARCLALLMIDTQRLDAEIRYEAPPSNVPAVQKIVGEVHYEHPEGIEDFPHIYGALNLDAVVDVLPLEPGPGGRFSFPRHLLNGFQI